MDKLTEEVVRWGGALTSLIMVLLGWKCGCENCTRAFRGPDGRDYVRCVDCGKAWVSKIQFG